MGHVDIQTVSGILSKFLKKLIISADVGYSGNVGESSSLGILLSDSFVFVGDEVSDIGAHAKLIKKNINCPSKKNK